MVFRRRLRILGVGLGLWLAAPATAMPRRRARRSRAAYRMAQGAMLPGVTVTLTSSTQGNALTATTDSEGRFVFAIVRPDTYTLKVSAAGLQDPRAHQPRRQRERPSVGRRADARRRRDDRRSDRLEPRQRAADDERRALVHARERGAEEHRQQRRACSSTSRRSCRAPCRRERAATRSAQVSGFTVNGQRPNSNNMTIDGVANIDTGDNGGNMATTNIDAVAEFKVLTNAYQAGCGRASAASCRW